MTDRQFARFKAAYAKAGGSPYSDDAWIRGQAETGRKAAAVAAMSRTVVTRPDFEELVAKVRAEVFPGRRKRMPGRNQPPRLSDLAAVTAAMAACVPALEKLTAKQLRATRDVLAIWIQGRVRERQHLSPGALDALRAAGGDAWDTVPDPAALLGRDGTDGPR